MSIPYWLETPGAWNLLRLGNHVMPGLWDLEYEAKFIVDVAKAKNADGATILDLGRDAVPFTLIGRIVSRSDWKILVPIMQEISAKIPATGAQRGERVHYDIDHPKAKLIGLKKVYFTIIESPKIERGVLNLRMRGVEVARHIKEKKGKTNVAKKPNVRTTSGTLQTQDQIYVSTPDGTSNGPSFSGTFEPFTPAGP